MRAGPRFYVGRAVWFRPACIGYGYDYGEDYGIPARIIDFSPKRIRIAFTPKGIQDYPIHVSVARKNLVLRDV